MSLLASLFQKIKNSKFELAGICLLLLFASVWFYNCEFLGGGDLGVSATSLSDFAGISKYTWNNKFELGRPNEQSLSWYLYYSFLSLFNNQVSLIKYSLFFISPLILTYVLVYRAFYRLHKKALVSFGVSLAFLLNPLSVKVYLSVPIQATYYLFPLVGYLFYIFSMIYTAEFEIKKALILGFLLFPMLLIPFSNIAFLLPVIFAFLLLAVFNKASSLKKFLTPIALILLLSSFFLLPLILTILSSASSFGLSTDINSLLSYVTTESQSVNFYENFFPASPIRNLESIFWLLSLTVLLISFLPMIISKRNKKIDADKKLYFTAAFLFLIGIFLSKGIAQPMGEVNSVLYQLFSSFSFAFRSPFSKFPIITIISMTIMFYYGLCLLMTKRVIFRLALFTALALMIISGFSLRVTFLQQDLYISDNSYSQHMEELKQLLAENGITNEDRVLLLPVNYGVFSFYNFSSSGIYRGASNEYVTVGIPIVSNYQWGGNTYLSNMVFHSKIGDIEGLKRDLEMGNIRCVVFDYSKRSGEPSSINSSQIFGSLEKIATVHKDYEHWELLFFGEAIGQFYKVEHTSGVINSHQIFPENANVIPVTLAPDEINISNSTLSLSIPPNTTEGAVDFVLPQDVLLNSSDIELSINLRIDDPKAISVVYFGLNTKDGYLTFLLPKPYQVNREYDLDSRNAVAVHNFAISSPIEKARLSVWKNKNANKTLHVDVERITFSETPSKSTNSPVQEYTYVNPTLWKVKVNATEPFLLSFSESYSSLWEAKIYKDGEMVEAVTPVPLHDTINGFWINQTGQLDVTIEYVPQSWFFYGSVISAATFAVCAVYLTYSFAKDKSLFSRVKQKFICVKRQ